MFSYNCEKCGREVPPAYSECPDCAAKAAGSGVGAAVAEPPPPQTAPAPPPVVRAAPAPAPPPTKQNAGPKAGTPGWVIALLVAGVLGLGGYVLIDKGLPMWRAGAAAPAVEEATIAPVETVSSVPAAVAPEVSKYLQITGLRITEASRKPQITMAVVNHAAAELVDIKTTVLVRTTKDAAGSPPIAKLQLKLASIGANEVKDITMPFPTNLRAYELPDWQFLIAELAPE